MHKLFRAIRKKKNEISETDARSLLKTCRRAALAINGDDGYPYAVPVNFFYDEPENRIYFHSGKTGYKIDAMRSCDKVCFTVWNDGYIEEGDWAYTVSSCVVFGRASLITDPAITEEKIRQFAMKYYPSKEEAEAEIESGIRAVQLVAIDIEHISGKRVCEK